MYPKNILFNFEKRSTDTKVRGLLLGVNSELRFDSLTEKYTWKLMHDTVVVRAISCYGFSLSFNKAATLLSQKTTRQPDSACV